MDSVNFTAFFQGFVLAGCLLLLAVIATWCAIRWFGKSCKAFLGAFGKDKLTRWVFACVTVGFVMYGATKGRITFTDKYITNQGSYLTNDVIHLEFVKSLSLIPDDTEVLVYVKDTTDTNATEYTQLEPVITVTNSPYEYNLADATNYNVLVSTTYVPPLPVISNLLFETGGKIPYRGTAGADLTALIPGSHFEDHDPTPRPIAQTSDGLCQIWEFGDEDAGSTNRLWLGDMWFLNGNGIWAKGYAPEGGWTLGDLTMSLDGTNVNFTVGSTEYDDFDPDDGTWVVFSPTGTWSFAENLRGYTNATFSVSLSRETEGVLESETLILAIPRLGVEYDDDEDN